MSEIAKCRCGTDAEWQISTDGKVGRWCRRCGIHGPWCDFEELMDAAWNSLMRPRPVARWGAPAVVTYLYVGRAVLGYVLTSQSGGESAVCGITGELFRGYDARAWLEERVKAAGFDVREEVSDE